MPPRKNSPLVGLRRRAEGRPREAPTNAGASPDPEVRRLLHELQVRQIEMEMQKDELRRVRLELENTRKKYWDLYDFAPVGYFSVDAKGAIQELSLTAAEMLGVERARLAKDLFSLFIVPDERPAFSQFVREILRTRAKQSCEVTLRRRDERLMYVQLEGVVQPGGEAADRVIVAMADTTERRMILEQMKALNNELEARVQERTKELSATNKELEAFCYSVSHDLRAPLRAIDGFSQAILEDFQDRFDDKAKNWFGRIRSASQRMGHLIDDLLRLSRLTRAAIHEDDVDLTALAQSIADEIKAADPGRRTEFAIAPGLKVKGDPDLLRVVLQNLFDNAWKFTSKKPAARIQFGAAVHKGVPAFFVRDDGPGFSMEYAGKLFGAFQRLHDEKEFPGTGIGLATVQRVIHRHGGRVWAEGREGAGARFYFTLPAMSFDGNAVRPVLPR